MKKTLTIFLVLIMALGLFACNGGKGDSDTTAPAIDSSLSGTWYGEDNTLILDVYSDGTGVVDINTKISQAKFSFEDGVFTVTSEAYSLTGGYTLSGDTLTVESAEGTVVFTKTPAGMIPTT